MPIVVNGTTLTNLIVGGTNITKVQVRQNESSPYVIVFEQGGVVKMAYIYAGNWKMNKLKADIDSFFTDFNTKLNQDSNKEVIIFPPACYLSYVKEKIDASPRSSMIKLGIQNICNQNALKGSYTGQISVQQAADCGCSYVLVGQAEVRENLGLTNAQCEVQIRATINQGMTAIYCVGENLEQHIAGEQNSVLTTQLAAIMGNLQNTEVENNLIIVYEPIWAIGTGKTATSSDAELACSTIYNIVSEQYGSGTADKMPILYGGSLKLTNVQEYLSQPTIDGGLFGGVSLQSTAFANTINADVNI